MIVTYRVFREENDQYTIREVFYERDGQMITYGASPVTPVGGSLGELTQELAWMIEALALPVLTIAEADAEIAKHPPRPKNAGKNISHEELVAKLGLASAHQTIDNGFDNFTVGSKEIEVDPEKLGGTPVFPGTRVPIQNLFDCLEAGESVEEFLDQFPTVTHEQVILVLEASKEQLIAAHQALA